MRSLARIFKKTFTVKSTASGPAVYQRLFPFSFLGIGLYWSWIYIVCFSTLIFPDAEGAAPLAQSSEYVSILFYVLVLAVSALMIKPLTRGMTIPVWLTAFPVAAGIGTVLMMLSLSAMEGAFLLTMAGAALTGVGTGVLLNMWGLLFTQMSSEYAPLRVAMALLVSFAAYLLIAAMPYYLLVALTSCLPLASCLLIFVAKSSREFIPEKPRAAFLAHDAPGAGASGGTPGAPPVAGGGAPGAPPVAGAGVPSGVGRHKEAGGASMKAAQAYPWQLGVGLLTSGLPMGLLLGMAFVHASMGVEVPLVCIIANAVISVAILAYLALRSNNLGFSTIYRFIMPLIASGLFIVVAFDTRYILASLLLVRTGYALFDMLIWLQLQKVFSSTGTFRMFAASRLCLDGGVFIGLSAHRFLIAGNPAALPYALLATAVLLVFILPVVLTRRRVASAWYLLPASSKEAMDFDGACHEIAEIYHLTARETEIMALIARGRNGAYIQDHLFISLSTFQTHSKKLNRKLAIHSRKELMLLFDGQIERSRKFSLASARRQGADQDLRP
jgi:DNA-binding CsgD family transcriptional regulator